MTNVVYKGLEELVFNKLMDESNEPSLRLFSYPTVEYEDLRAIDRIPVGNTSPDLDGDDVFMDMSTACRVAFVASTRGGKSYLLSEIMSHCYQSGYMIAITNDNKNEYVHAAEKTSGWFRTKIHPNFVPKGLPIVPLIPRFLWELREQGRNDYLPVQFDLDQITERDLITIMGFNNIFSKDQFINALKLIWSKYSKKGISSCTFEQFYNDVRDSDRFSMLTGGMHGKTTQNALMTRLVPIKTSFVFGSGNKVDLRQLLLENKIPCLCIEGSDKVDIQLIYTYMAILMRNIRILKMEDPVLRKRRLILVNDETSFIAPKSDYPSSKFECLETNQRGAYYGIYQFFGIQDTETVDPTIISQCKYIFISAWTSGADVRRICRTMNLPEETRYYIQENIHRLKPRADGQRGWFMLEKGMDGFPRIVYPYAPACGFKSKTFS